MFKTIDIEQYIKFLDSVEFSGDAEVFRVFLAKHGIPVVSFEIEYSVDEPFERIMDLRRINRIVRSCGGYSFGRVVIFYDKADALKFKLSYA